MIGSSEELAKARTTRMTLTPYVYTALASDTAESDQVAGEPPGDMQTACFGQKTIEGCRTSPMLEL